jgi:hypothetical protein
VVGTLAVTAGQTSDRLRGPRPEIGRMLRASYPRSRRLCGGGNPLGNITMSVGSLQDLITEEVGCKSGLLLASFQAGNLLERRHHSDG